MRITFGGTSAATSYPLHFCQCKVCNNARINGQNIGGIDHLNTNQFISHIIRMREEKLLKENARIFATHISHEGNPTHSELVDYGKKFGYEIAYDGLVI